jgi:hypothetical protein
VGKWSFREQLSSHRKNVNLINLHIRGRFCTEVNESRKDVHKDGLSEGKVERMLKWCGNRELKIVVSSDLSYLEISERDSKNSFLSFHCAIIVDFYVSSIILKIDQSTGMES